MLVAYLNNPSEEALFGSNRIKEQHETMKLQNKEIKQFKSWVMNSTDQQSENSQKKESILRKKLFLLYTQY